MYILDFIKVTQVVKRQTITMQWSIIATLEIHFKSHTYKCHMALVLGTRKSHLRCFTHYFHLFLFPLASVKVQTVVYFSIENSFIKKICVTEADSTGHIFCY